MHRLQSQETRVPNPGLLLLTSCVTLGKLLNFSEPQIPHLQHGDNIYRAGFLEEQIGYQVEYLDNAWHLEDTQHMLILPHLHPLPPQPPFSLRQQSDSAGVRYGYGVAARTIRSLLSYINAVLCSRPRWNVWSVWSRSGYVTLRGALVEWSTSGGR